MAATVTEHLQGYSQALYSTWLWYRPFRILFDAGEGVALKLQNAVFGVRHLVLSHGHLDHLSGLPSLFNIRNNGMGDNAQPLTIVHPEGDIFIAWMRAYLERSVNFGDLEVEWLPVPAGAAVPLDDSRSLESFATSHVKGYLTLGYRVVEHRRRKRPELGDWTEEQLRDLARREGREAVSEPYQHPVMVYGGDGLAPAAEEIAGAEVACLEATFLTDADRGKPTHATLPEAVAAAAEAGVGRLILFHLSGRYRLRDVRKAAEQEIRRTRFGGETHLLWQDRLIPL